MAGVEWSLSPTGHAIVPRHEDPQRCDQLLNDQFVGRSGCVDHQWTSYKERESEVHRYCGVESEHLPNSVANSFYVAKVPHVICYAHYGGFGGVVGGVFVCVVVFGGVVVCVVGDVVVIIIIIRISET